MTTEIREVTVEQEVYIAEDGTIFTDESECVEYEYNLLTKTFECFNQHYEPADVESCCFLKIKHADAVNNFKQVCVYLGTSSDGVDKPGMYMYSDYIDRWVNLDDVIFNLTVLPLKNKYGNTDEKENQS